MEQNTQVQKVYCSEGLSSYGVRDAMKCKKDVVTVYPGLNEATCVKKSQSVC